MKKFVDLYNKLAEILEQEPKVAQHSRMPQLSATVPTPHGSA
jgi:hypothetical protein